MINEREFVNERMIHSRAHCPSKFSDGSGPLSAVSARIVAAPPCTMKRSKIFGGGKKEKRKREEKSRRKKKREGRLVPGWDNGDIRYTILETVARDSRDAANDNRAGREPIFVFLPNLPSTLFHACQKSVGPFLQSLTNDAASFSPLVFGGAENEIKSPISSFSSR